MILRIWHLDAIPNRFRTTFELPAWPYFHSDAGPIPDETLRYLQQWGVFRLEIEGKANRLMLPLAPTHRRFINGEYVENWGKLFAAHQTAGDINEDFHIKAWNPAAAGFRKSVGKSPDNAAWWEWNKAVTIKSVNADYVAYA